MNPISSDLNVLRSSLFPNLIYYLEKNLNRGFSDQSLFEIGPVFTGNRPGDQITVICGIKKQLYDEQDYKKVDHLDIFEIKKDIIQTLVELGIDKDEILVEDKSPTYYHPGISGSISSKDGKYLFGYFGQIHPKITVDSYGFEIFLENVVSFKSHNKKNKESLLLSDYQKSDRDFAFLVNKESKAQDLIEVIKKIDKDLIKEIKIFDVYEGDNIPSDKKSIALKVTIQSDHKTLNENDLTNISKKIVSTVEEKTGAKLRS